MDVFIDFFKVEAFEWIIIEQKSKHDNSTGPSIALVRIDTSECFRRHIIVCSYIDPVLEHLLLLLNRQP